jgi:anaerobic ribonucleoside-triphosphate reductase activating protein
LRGIDIAVLQVGHILSAGRIYGPGVRFVIWLQGCTLGCKGCWNQQFWPTVGGAEYNIEQLVTQILEANVEGITLLGGEPMQQAEPILELIQRVKEHNLTVFLYTGYTEKEFDATMRQCAELSDILIAGRYIESKRNTHLRWRGSSNQIIQFPTGYYNGEDLEEVREVEVHISGGNANVYGYPTEEEVNLS